MNALTITDIITPARVCLAEPVQSKKRALEQLAGVLAEGTPYLTDSEIFSGLVSRETLGSTGIGDGVAIPHARVKGIDECIGAFLRLPQAIEFESADQQPVDLVFGLVVPEKASEAHLDLLRTLAEVFSESRAIESLRATQDDNELYRILLDHDPGAG